MKMNIKIFFLSIYLIYFILFNINQMNSIFNKGALKNDVELKNNINFSKCLLLIGGSNVRMGLSAKIISNNKCQAVNLGVSSENGGFNKYLKWIDNKKKEVDSIIYSPSLIWSDNINFKNEAQGNYIDFPSISLLSFLKIILYSDDKIERFDKYGDQENFNCNRNFRSFGVNIKNFNDNNVRIVEEIERRSSKLKEIFQIKNIYFRIPPVYIKDPSKAEEYRKMMSDRLNLIKQAGVLIIDGTIVETDSNLFCDSFHPNANGRAQFSREIALP